MFVAHRLGSIASTDRVVVLAEGRIQSRSWEGRDSVFMETQSLTESAALSLDVGDPAHREGLGVHITQAIKDG